jgi:restriction endonuclease NotI
MSKVLELFGVSTISPRKQNWQKVIEDRQCPFLSRLCLKNRKSRPDILIGTCSVRYGRKNDGVIICPHRLLERRQIFTDCQHLLTLHEPGNEFHIVPEISIPGGSVDYFLVSVSRGKVKDFVGIELQTVDTTGTVWPERERFLNAIGLKVNKKDVNCKDTFGMNWKMTAKTILVQMHHKVETFEHISKHLVLVVQDCLMDYMKKNFAFGHMRTARLGDAAHLHSYRLDADRSQWKLELATRLSTDAQGISRCLGLQTSAKVGLEMIVSQLESKISKDTLFSFGPISDVTPVTEPS